MAGVLLIGLGMIQWVLPTYQEQSPAAVPTGPSLAGNPYITEDENTRMINLRGQPNFREVRRLRPDKRPQTAPAPPRFIIDALPASYEATEIKF
jgi:hypothetical protein